MSVKIFWESGPRITAESRLRNGEVSIFQVDVTSNKIITIAFTKGIELFYLFSI